MFRDAFHRTFMLFAERRRCAILNDAIENLAILDFSSITEYRWSVRIVRASQSAFV
jgi:hypothetical protein